ncbi:MAG: hypothetical protein GY707_09115 [Desulfobacteraceae bacterium]|nr:hypothetical protein [Desulfobacteraceae bacterium]
MPPIDQASEEWKTQCFVNYIISNLKPLPKHMRKQAFNSFVKKRADKEEIEMMVKRDWNK